MSDLTHPAAAIAVTATTYLLHSTIIIALAWLAASRFRPAVADRVWKAALVVPLLTTTAQLVWVDQAPLSLPLASSDPEPRVTSRVPDEPEPTRSRVVATGPTVEIRKSVEAHVPTAAPPEEPIALRPVPTTRRPVPVTHPVRSAPSPPPQVAAAPRHVSRGQNTARATLPLAITVTVLACVAIGFVRLLRTGVLTRRLLRATSDEGCELVQSLVDSQRARWRIRKPIRVACCTTCTEPAAVGVWRYHILLPEGFAQQIDQSQLTALLGHEIAHLVRRDTLMAWFNEWVRRLLPWQPLNRLVIQRWRGIAETLCDDWAVAHGANRFTLARGLTWVAEWRGAAVALPGCPATGTRSALTGRVERLVTASREAPASTEFLRRGTTFILIIAALAVTLWGPRTTWPQLRSDGLRSGAAEPARTPPAKRGLEIAARPEDSRESGASTAVLIQQIATDLERATDLAESDPDPRIRETAARLRARLHVLQSHTHDSAAANELSSTNQQTETDRHSEPKDKEGANG